MGISFVAYKDKMNSTSSLLRISFIFFFTLPTHPLSDSPSDSIQHFTWTTSTHTLTNIIEGHREVIGCMSSSLFHGIGRTLEYYFY